MNVYFDPRVLRVFLLGISSGFPWVMIGSVLTLWLKDSGLSRTDIGFAGAIFAVYSVNFLWAPLIDKHQPPLLSFFGRRKSWIILSLCLMAIACIAVSFSEPSENARLTVLLCLAIAACSATQDIAIDAYRIDSIPESENELIPAAAAMATAGWWTGFSGLGALALFLSDFDAISWSTLYQLCAIAVIALSLVICVFPRAERRTSVDASKIDTQKYIDLTRSATSTKRWLAIALATFPVVVLIWVIAGTPLLPEYLRNHVLFIPVLFGLVIGALILAIHLLTMHSTQVDFQNLSHNRNHSITLTVKLTAYLLSTLGQPFASFFQRSGASLAIRILLFIFLFKIGEAFLGRMSVLFYSELGFSNTEIGQYSKLLSWWVTIVVSLLGGWFTIRFGMVKGLMLAGVAMASSNCLFSVMASIGPEKWLFAITVIVDGITSAWSNVAFVAFISALVDRNYSASQYALFASLGTMGRTVLSSSSGSWIDAMGGNWAVFFLITALMVIPALIILRSIAKHPLLAAQLHRKTD